METQIINALKAMYTADKLKAVANLQNYISNPAGIGEHPDIVSECNKLVSDIADADGKLAILNGLIPKSGGDTK